MEFQYLKYFSVVAETLNFSEAAKRCHVSQPSLSAQIRILEDRLGTQLFHRNKRKVLMTKEGKALLPRVKKILVEINELSAAAKDLQNPLSGTLFVGATPLIPSSGIFDKLSELKKKNQSLAFHFTEGGANELIAGLSSGQLDIIFLPFRDKLKSPEIAFCMTEPMDVAICRPKNYSKSLPFINIKKGCGLGEFLGQAAKELRADTSEMLQATHIDMIKKWIQFGIGWSILPTVVIQKNDEKNFSVSKEHKIQPIQLCSAMLKGQRADAILTDFQ